MLHKITIRDCVQPLNCFAYLAEPQPYSTYIGTFYILSQHRIVPGEWQQQSVLIREAMIPELKLIKHRITFWNILIPSALIIGIAICFL